jgi:hypothetical protein
MRQGDDSSREDRRPGCWLPAQGAGLTVLEPSLSDALLLNKHGDTHAAHRGVDVDLNAAGLALSDARPVELVPLLLDRLDKRRGKIHYGLNSEMQNEADTPLPLHEQERRELANIERNRGRFAIRGSESEDRWQVVDVRQMPPVPRSAFMSHAEVVKERDRLTRSDD